MVDNIPKKLKPFQMMSTNPPIKRCEEMKQVTIQGTIIPLNTRLDFQQRSAIRYHIGALGQDQMEKDGYILIGSQEGIQIRVTESKGDMVATMVGITKVRKDE